MAHRTTDLVDTSASNSAIGIVYGSGTPMKALNAVALEIARTTLPILVVGESGAGKDTYARLIHSLSRASDGPFRKINCTVLDAERLSSQVSEATRDLAAHPVGGTLYLDNVQELDLAGQRALFSQLSDCESALQHEDRFTRFISSTTRSLDMDVESGRFRRELYFRLNGACLHLPPLRERKEDVASLLEHFLVKDYGSSKGRVVAFSKKTIDILVNYHWPGNIRELENFARKVAVFGDVHRVLPELKLSWKAKPLPAEGESSPSLKTVARAASRQAEREMIMHALECTRWNRKRAAQQLQISYKSLLYKIKQIGAFPGDREN
jgi:two-component system, NtrC family, response regulator AtoC